MGKFKYITADVYRRGIYIFIGTRKELYDWAKKTFNKESDEELIHTLKEGLTNTTSIGTTYCLECGQSLVWLPKLSLTPRGIGNLAHELSHATMSLLDFIGVEYHYSGSNEPYTYLLEFFITKALEKRGYKNVEKD